jgi:hypothetical protein
MKWPTLVVPSPLQCCVWHQPYRSQPVQSPAVLILLLHLFCSAACGINLTAASHIFILEPCLNAAVEAQAIGRAWRMGQTRSVVVKRLYVKVRMRACIKCMHALCSAA